MSKLLKKQLISREEEKKSNAIRCTSPIHIGLLSAQTHHAHFDCMIRFTVLKTRKERRIKGTEHSRWQREKEKRERGREKIKRRSEHD